MRVPHQRSRLPPGYRLEIEDGRRPLTDGRFSFRSNKINEA